MRRSAYTQSFARFGGLLHFENLIIITEVQYLAKKVQKSSSGMDIPDYQFEVLARCLLPKIQKYYESDEGKKDLADYRAEKTKQAQAKSNGK